MTEIPPKVTSDNAEIMAGYERLQEMQQQSLDQQKADTVGNFYSQLGLHEAGQEAQNALAFLGEWQKTVNGDSEAVAQARADGIPPPQVSSGVDNGSLFSNDATNKEDRWDALGKVLGGGSGG